MATTADPRAAPAAAAATATPRSWGGYNGTLESGRHPPVPRRSSASGRATPKRCGASCSRPASSQQRARRRAPRPQAFDNDRVYADPRGLEQLQAAAIDKLKKFEFSLRRKAETGNDSLSLSGSDQVPDGFRQAIEEYYRSLAKKAQR